LYPPGKHNVQFGLARACYLLIIIEVYTYFSIVIKYVRIYIPEGC